MKKIPRSDIESIAKLADRFAEDEDFTAAVRAHKPGEEAKLTSMLAEHGFKASHVEIQARGAWLEVEVCVCVENSCICVTVQI